ncbi:MAG TPA: hypothetical protein PLF88_13610 [Opitutaceae bacterium]|nr:hypothetical protein [Opitutaceae bacterium]HRJ45845.1 hypothetical protein [Opitutaceae bacterium]
MRFQPNRDYVSNDEVQTPAVLARMLVRHFRPRGRVLEPCCGEGRILHCLPRGACWCEIRRGRDFFAWTEPVDWIITNPPWSQIRPFLQHAMKLADHVVFLLTINHVWTKARLRDIREAGFGIREILLVDMPPEFPQSGFQLGAVHLQRGWRGRITLSAGQHRQEAKRRTTGQRPGQ